ncbi:hypothetical protein F2Q68_00004865 [Brassica cretica]|uniref:Uncharacterized protein n=1 Tax=Brassica cretica TaxID=69181 RepID=A0A8S9JJF5_BRACR|nr:hypothetical protein F2Q68_00004865 [Brassica cretica]
MQFHLWFPLLEAIVRLFSRFGLAIGQVSPRGLQHVVGILVLSYERGLPLDVDHLEGLLAPVGSLATVRLNPRNNMAIIAGVGIDGATEKIFARDFLRLAESVDSGNTLADLDVHPLESIPEDDIDRATRVDENPCDLEISYHEIDYERIAVGVVDPTDLFFIESDCSFREVIRRGLG